MLPRVVWWEDSLHQGSVRLSVVTIARGQDGDSLANAVTRLADAKRLPAHDCASRVLGKHQPDLGGHCNSKETERDARPIELIQRTRHANFCVTRSNSREPIAMRQSK